MTTSDTGRAGLEEQRQVLLDSLRDLEREHDAGDIADDDYERLRDDYTARAAAVLRLLDAGGDGEQTSVDEDGDGDGDEADEPPSRSRRRGPLVTVAVILVIASLAGVGVAVFSGEDVSSTSTSGTPAEQLARAHQLDTQGKAADAVKLYDSVLKAQPDNVEALTYKGWLLARAGLGDLALQSLDKAIAVKADYPDAHFFRGMVLYRYRHDPQSAITEFETFLKDNPPPDAVPAVQGVLETARHEVATSTSAPPTTAAPAPPG